MAITRPSHPTRRRRLCRRRRRRPSPRATPPPAPGPQDSDGIFTAPLRWAADAGGILSTSFHALKDAATGAGKVEFPDQPELSEMPSDQSGVGLGAGLRIAGAYLAGSTPAQIGDVATKALPGSSTTDASGAPLVDKFGNPMISYNGQTYYLKKPGFLSAGNVAGMAGTVAPAVLAASGVGALPLVAGEGVIPLAVRAVAQGGGQAAVSAARDLAAGALGSDQGVSGTRAGEAAVGGAVAEPVVAGLGALKGLLGGAGTAVAGAWRDMFGGGGSLLTDAAKTAPAATAVTPGMLTKTGQMVFDKAGVPPGSFTTDQLKAAEPILAKGGAQAIASAPEATAATTSRNLLQSASTGIPMTTGQLTGDPMQLALEDRLRQAASPATSTMRDFATDQQAATKDAATALIPGARPGVAAPDEAELGQALDAQMQARLDALKQNTSAAYSKLPYLTKGGMAANGPSATFDPSVSSDLMDQVKDVSQRYLSSVTPAGNEAQATIRDLISRPAPTPGPGGTVAGVTYTPPGGVPPPIGGAPAQPAMVAQPFNVGAADTALRRLDQLYAGASTNGDRAAVAALRGKLSDWIDQAALGGAVSGDPQVIADWQAARAARQQQGEFMAQNSPAANRFMNMVTQGDPSGQEVINGLYGAGQLGSKTGTTQVLDHLQSQFPAGSPEWTTLQQAGVRRMLFGGTEKTAEMSPNNIANRIDEAVNGNGKEITTRLFDQPTIDALTNFRDTMRTLQQSAKQNPSGTAYSIGTALQSLAARIPIVGAPFRAEAQAVRQARAAVAPSLPRQLVARPTDLPLSMVRRLAPAAGAVTAQTGAPSWAAQMPGALPLARGAYGVGRAVGGLLGHVNPF